MGDGSRLPGEPADWEKTLEMLREHDEDRNDSDWPFSIEMGDNQVHIEGDGFMIHMEDGEDGSERMQIILESATKLTASALTLATMASLY